MPLGIWGGDHIRLDVAALEATVEFDCAHGTLPGPLVLASGRFDVQGTFVLEHGGPVRPGEILPEQPARYRGRVDGGSMTLDVTLLDTGQNGGLYALAFGGLPRLLKCL